MFGKLHDIDIHHNDGVNNVPELTVTETAELRFDATEMFTVVYGEALVEGEQVYCAINSSFPEGGWWVVTGTKIPSAWMPE